MSEKMVFRIVLCVHMEMTIIVLVYKLKEIDANHVTAWSRGGTTTIDNCQMLCKPHNRAKGNK